METRRTPNNLMKDGQRQNTKIKTTININI